MLSGRATYQSAKHFTLMVQASCHIHQGMHREAIRARAQGLMRAAQRSLR